MTTLWSGRFDGAPDRDAFEFGVSFGFDRRLFDEDVTASISWARSSSTIGSVKRGLRMNRSSNTAWGAR